MAKIKSLYKKLARYIGREVLMYLIFGVLTTLVGYGTYYLFRILFGDNVLFFGENKTVLPNILSWICAVVFAYVTNRRWVFNSALRARGAVLKEAAAFIAARLMTLVIDVTIMYLLIDLPRVTDPRLELGAKILDSAVVVVLNYVFSKLLVFGGKKK